jgi:hypothetical protein
MKNSLVVFVSFITIFSSTLFAQSTPQVIKPGIKVNRIMTIQNGAIRVAKDPVTKKLYYLLTDGSIYEVIRPSGGSAYDSLVFSAAEHGVDYVQGLTFHDSTLFLAGNKNSSTALTKGIVVRGKLQSNGNRVWDTLMITTDYQTADYFDHLFTGIAVHPSGDSVYVCSGARGDHGEIQTRYGTYPGLRGVPVTSLILALPANDPSTIIIHNDSVFIDTSSFVYCRGIRSTFDMAFDSNGNLFGVENSGDYDHNEEMNLLLRGKHYGYPWRMGESNNPQQFPSFNPATDPLINHYSRAWKNGFWNNDPTFPSAPFGVSFESPMKNYGPDCDKYRDSTGQVNDASDNGMPLGTFSAHRSPLGLVFDNQHVLGASYMGDAFMLSWTKGYDSCGCILVPDTAAGTFVDPSQDLVHLDISYDTTANEFRLNATRIIGEFEHPVDADIDNNMIYVIENGYGNTSGLYLVTFSDTLSCNPVIEVSIPDSCNPDSNFVFLPAMGILPNIVQWYSSSGSLLFSDTVYSVGDTVFALQQGDYYVVFSDSGFCGTDTIDFIIPDAVNIFIDSVSHTTCIGCSDGKIYFTISGGTPPYNVSISSGVLVGDTLTQLSAGQHSIDVFDDNGCMIGVVVTILDNPSGILFPSNGQVLSIYPNPVRETINVNLKTSWNSIRLVDMNGKEIKHFKNPGNINSGHVISISSSGMENGIYTLELQTENQTVYKKLVVLN